MSALFVAMLLPMTSGTPANNAPYVDRTPLALPGTARGAGDVVSGQSFSVIASIPVGSTPVATTYDIGHGYVYVTNYNSSNVSVLSGTSVAGSVAVGSGPISTVYDSSHGYVYVTNLNSISVSVLSGKSVVGTVPVGFDPSSAAFDSSNGYVYVVNEGSSNVSVLSGTSLTGTLRVGSQPSSATFDSSNGYVYVTNYGSSNVSVLDGTSVVGTVPVGSLPVSAVYDSSSHYVYVINEGTNNVSVLDGTSVVGTVPVGLAPVSAAYDGSDGYVYVTNHGSSNVTVLDGTSVLGTVPVGSQPSSATFDSSNGYVYVTNYGSSNVSVLGGASVVGTVPVGSLPLSAVYDSSNHYVYVVNEGTDNVTVIGSTATNQFTVTFATSPASCGSITFNGTVFTNGGSVQVPAGSYSVSATACSGYSLQSLAGTGSVSVTSGVATVNGAGGITATFVPSSPSNYTVTFTTSPSTCGSILFNGTNYSNGQSVQVLAGSYAVSATVCSGYSLQSLAGTGSVSVASGVATVSGAGGITATFVPSSSPKYTVTFTTSPSTCGSILFNGTNYTNGQSVQVFAGPYAVSAQACSGFSLQNLTGTGSVSVNGSTATVSGTGGVAATFTALPPSMFAISFATSPASCGSITFNGTNYSNGQSVQVLAGSYAVSATACSGYSLQSLAGTGSVSVASGVATVSGAGGITATFVPSSSPKYTVTFTTSPSTCGSILFNGTNYTNGQSVQVFAGPYVVSAQACSGYSLQALTGFGSVSVSSGVATVSGTGDITATFARNSSQGPPPSNSSSPPPGFLGLPDGEGYLVLVVIVAIVVVAVAAILLSRQKRNRPPGASTGPGPATSLPPSRPR